MGKGRKDGFFKIVVWKGLTEKRTSEQEMRGSRPKDTWRKSIPGNGAARAKVPRLGRAQLVQEAAPQSVRRQHRVRGEWEGRR